MSLITFQGQFSSEKACLEFLEAQRWSNGRFCPHCGSYSTYAFKDGKLFKCGDCKKQFTVKVGTIFSDSHIPLTKWFYAIYLCTSLKKGISSIQLAKYLGITQKTAWFMLQRVRYGLETAGHGELLSGVVEVDETYIGGVRRGGRVGPADKAVVFGAVERGGKSRLRHLPTAGVRVIRPQIDKLISQEATIYSDQYRSYKGLSKSGYRHDSVNHSDNEYARGQVHTNTIEGGVWKHFKKSIEAIYMQVSRKHLQLYCSEFEYRYNTRQLSDAERFNDWFRNCRGRLKYRELIG
ncbi:MAG: IS1595 family transposase [Candidatus Saccharimonadales bacterium]